MLTLSIHKAWVCDCPIIGDKTYDGAGPAKHLRDKGLFLCSNKVTLEHPFHSATEWTSKLPNDMTSKGGSNLNTNGRVSIEENGRTLLINVEIDLPTKFDRMMMENMF